MPVAFRFARLSIHGFRGIRELEIDLPAGKPVHLIGSNNSGKSTSLEAFALALASGGFHQFAPEKFDFFHDAAGQSTTEFAVVTHLASQDVTHLPAVQGVGNPIPVHAIQVKGTVERGGRLSHRRLLLDSSGKAITYSPRTMLKGDTKEAYRGRANLGWSQPYARLDDIRNEMPDVWLLTPQNLHRSLYEWRTGPLQRLSQMLAQRFLKADWEFKPANQTTDKHRKRAEALRRSGDLSVVWPGSLEACLAVPAGQKATPEWQSANTDQKPLAQLQKDHAGFVATCQQIQVWLLG